MRKLLIPAAAAALFVVATSAPAKAQINLSFGNPVAPAFSLPLTGGSRGAFTPFAYGSGYSPYAYNTYRAAPLWSGFNYPTYSTYQPYYGYSNYHVGPYYGSRYGYTTGRRWR